MSEFDRKEKNQKKTWMSQLLWKKLKMSNLCLYSSNLDSDFFKSFQTFRPLYFRSQVCTCEFIRSISKWKPCISFSKANTIPTSETKVDFHTKILKEISPQLNSAYSIKVKMVQHEWSELKNSSIKEEISCESWHRPKGFFW